MRNVSYFIAILLLIAAILGATLWYANKKNAQVGPAFDLTRQFIPKGTASLDVPQALTAFNFSKPLPFFDEHNVVQSLTMPSSAVSTSSETYVSYSVQNQTIDTLYTAYRDYFTSSGWREIPVRQKGSNRLFFQKRAGPGQIHVVDALLMDNAKEQSVTPVIPTVTIAITLRQIVTSVPASAK